MITLFKIFEKITSIEINNDGLSEELLDILIDGISLITYKGKKRNKQNNYKLLKIVKLKTSVNKRDVNKNISTTKSVINITVNNGDEIKANYIKEEKFDAVIDNCIEIKINDNVVYHMDNDDFDLKTLVEKIVSQYKKFIETTWKIK